MYAPVGAAAVGLAAVWLIAEWIKHRKRERETQALQIRVFAEELCVVCRVRNYYTVFHPCGHMCCCTTCSYRLIRCPLCQELIELVVE